MGLGEKGCDMKATRQRLIDIVGEFVKRAQEENRELKLANSTLKQCLDMKSYEHEKCEKDRTELVAQVRELRLKLEAPAEDQDVGGTGMSESDLRLFDAALRSLRPAPRDEGDEKDGKDSKDNKDNKD